MRVRQGHGRTQGRQGCIVQMVMIIVGAQSPGGDAIGPYWVMNAGSIHCSCLPWLLQQLCQSPGVGHVSLSSLTLLQPELGENPHQHHDGHHSTDNIHDHVGPIPVWFLLDLCDGCRRFSSVCPDGCVIVGTGSLVQTVDFELTAKAVEAGTTTEQVDTCVTVEGWIPLAHDIIVTPATVTATWSCLVLHIWCGRCQCGL